MTTCISLWWPWRKKLKHKLLQDQELLLLVQLLRNSGISLKESIPGSEAGNGSSLMVMCGVLLSECKDSQFRACSIF